jgi:uncharacterized protein YjbI with pentapeptide repeats
VFLLTIEQIKLIHIFSTKQRLKSAVKQLYSSNLENRIAGIYDLEKIAKTELKFSQEIIEMLSSFVRNHASRPQNQLQPLSIIRADIQAALTVIARRDTTEKPENEPLNLSQINIAGANLGGANLERINFYQVNLAGANLCGANLRGAILSAANLSTANLAHANLEQAILNAANLEAANLSNANLHRANLYLAKLNRAILDHAILTQANLRECSLDKCSDE